VWADNLAPASPGKLSGQGQRAAAGDTVDVGLYVFGMTTVLIKHAAVVATFADGGAEHIDAGVFCRDGVIEAVGSSGTLPPAADEVIDARGCVVCPGLVNTHHHLFQTLTRAVPGAQDASLFGWLKTLYPIWQRLTPEDIYVSALAGLAELALSGCTTSSDHLYLFPNGARLDDEIRAARDIGMRFHAMRGSMSVGESAGGLPPDSLVEREDDILADCERVIGTFHDSSPHALIKVGIAPCSPFSVSEDLMRASADLARHHGVRLHTHLAENVEDVAYSRARFGKRPGQYAADLGWVGADVWHAHCVALDDDEIALFGRTQTGVAHCPCSNMRLGSGIARLNQLRRAGVPVGLGVDGSASNDSGSLLAEARQAMLLQRVANGPDAMTARAALRLATRGGAGVLGRAGAIGQLTPGFAADIAVFDLSTVAAAGSAWDPVAALVMCGPIPALHTLVGGRFVVRDGRLAQLDQAAVVLAHAARVRRLMA
jgi:cytosine/adenosine deaminase-related metal-dependent hydrolase